MIDILVKNGRIVEHDSTTFGDILIKNGKVVGISDGKSGEKAEKEIDAQGRYVLPGAIDTHSHIGQMPGPGLRRKQTVEETFHTESLNGAFGGVTTALNYIFTQDSIVKTLVEQREIAKNHSVINMFFHGALMNDKHLDEIEKAVAAGIRSFKIFLPYKGEEALRLGGLSSLDDGQIVTAFTRLRKCGALPVVHAENPELIDHYMSVFDGFDRQDMAAWEATRPGIVEGEAVNKVIYLADKLDCPLCIAHVSSKEAVEEIRRRNGKVLLETTPHYLTLTTDSGLDSLGKVSPPIRHSEDREALWEYIASGLPVVLGSDHNSWLKEHKTELWSGLSGLPGNVFLLPLLVSEGVYERGLSMEDVVRVSSYTAADYFGMRGRKGTLRVGADADLMILTTDISRRIDAEELPSMVDYSPYADYIFRAWPDTVVCAGKVLVNDGAVCI